MTAKIRAGSWEITTLDGGGLYLDGGAMFGSVPRVVWEGCIPPDDAHRIPLATRLLLAKNADENRIVVIDASRLSVCLSLPRVRSSSAESSLPRA